MKKQILNVGNALSKAEQKTIQGGGLINAGQGGCFSDADCCHYPNTQSYGYLCYDEDRPGGGYCAPGIYEFGSPCL